MLSQLVAIIGITVAFVSLLLPAFVGTQVAVVGVAFILLGAIAELVRIRKALETRRAAPPKPTPKSNT